MWRRWRTFDTQSVRPKNLEWDIDKRKTAFTTTIDSTSNAETLVNFGSQTIKFWCCLISNHPSLTMHLLHMYMIMLLRSGHVTLLRTKFQPLKHTLRVDEGDESVGTTGDNLLHLSAARAWSVLKVQLQLITVNIWRHAADQQCPCRLCQHTHHFHHHRHHYGCTRTHQNSVPGPCKLPPRVPERWTKKNFLLQCTSVPCILSKTTLGVLVRVCFLCNDKKFELMLTRRAKA